MAKKRTGNPMGVLAQEIENAEDRLKQLYALRDAQEEIDRRLHVVLGGSGRAKSRTVDVRAITGPKRRRRRSRKAGVTIEWLGDTLGKKSMTVKQLQEAAAKAGLSGLRIPVLLKEGK